MLNGSTRLEQVSECRDGPDACEEVLEGGVGSAQGKDFGRLPKQENLRTIAAIAARGAPSPGSRYPQKHNEAQEDPEPRGNQRRRGPSQATAPEVLDRSGPGTGRALRIIRKLVKQMTWGEELDIKLEGEPGEVVTQVLGDVWPVLDDKAEMEAVDRANIPPKKKNL
jgi:hypothetical protein